MFFSTAEDGSTIKGLAGVPNDRPMLLVGNHQTFALDLGLFVEQIVRERGFLPRGLAHPAIFAVSISYASRRNTIPSRKSAEDLLPVPSLQWAGAKGLGKPWG